MLGAAPEVTDKRQWRQAGCCAGRWGGHMRMENIRKAMMGARKVADESDRISEKKPHTLFCMKSCYGHGIV